MAEMHNLQTRLLTTEVTHHNIAPLGTPMSPLSNGCQVNIKISSKNSTFSASLILPEQELSYI
jgi:hypothetical protein